MCAKIASIAIYRLAFAKDYCLPNFRDVKAIGRSLGMGGVDKERK